MRCMKFQCCFLKEMELDNHIFGTSCGMVTNVILRSNINLSLFFPREGSLNVNYTVEFDNTTEAAAEATTATIDLRTGAETIEVLNATVSASELAVDGKTSKDRGV